MKKKTLYIIIGFIILLLLGGIGFMAMNKNPSSSTPSTQVPEQQENTVTENSVQSTLKDLISKGIAQKCTFSDKSDNLDMNGIMYMSGGKMRGDFNNVVEDKISTSHMIFTDNKAYNWAEGQKTGMMFAMDPNKVKDAQKNAAKNQQFDPDKVIDYKCSPWLADNSQFDPPRDVQFSDLSQMMTPKGDSNTTGGAPNMCAACNNLEGDAKTQCLTALKCS